MSVFVLKSNWLPERRAFRIEVTSAVRIVTEDLLAEILAGPSDRVVNRILCEGAMA